MTYIIPQLYKCPKCNHEFNWSGQNMPFPFNLRPFCDLCYLEWIMNFVPIAEPIKKEIFQ